MAYSFTWLLLAIVAFSATDLNHTKYELTQEWVTSPIPLPRAADGMAVGWYDHSIYLLGGYSYPYQLIRYDIPSHQMVDLGSHNLQLSVFGLGQFYTAQHDILYIISSPKQLISFDLRQAIFNHNHFSIPQPVGATACITSTTSYLYIIVGNHQGQIFSIHNNQFVGPPLPQMQKYRANLTCNINQQTSVLYAIGGNDQNKQPLNSVEFFDLNNNNPHAKWQVLNAHLLYPTQQARSIIYSPQNTIFIIGGWYIQHGKHQYANQVQIIDMSTNKITAGNTLAQPIENTAAVIVNNITYAFGGVYNNPIKQWQYAKFKYPTLAPTNAPTNSPTHAPTNSPTRAPTHSPTKSPTTSPTISPTTSPTRSPTNSPTRAPTHSPTKSPSIVPTKTPTRSPTHAPTHSPTHSPTKSPINSTTAAPTNSPTNSPTKSPTKRPTTATKTTHSTLLIPLLTIAIIICAVLSFYGFYMCRNVDKDLDRITGSNVNKKNNSKSENLFKSMSDSIPISYASKSTTSRENLDYMPMRAIDERRELRKKEMLEYDMANNMMFEEQVYFKNRQKAKAKKMQEKNVAVFRPPR